MITEKEIEQNIKYNLHEADFIGFKIDDNNLIFRFAIDCGFIDKYEDDPNYEDMYCIYDCYCFNFKNMETNYDGKLDIYGMEVIGFYPNNNKYRLSIDLDLFGPCIFFEFDCDCLNWKEIKLVKCDELVTDLDQGKWKVN